MRLLTVLFYIVLAVLGVMFATLNAEPAVVNLYFRSFSLPISIWVLISFSLGLILGLLISLPRYFGLKCQVLKQKHRLTACEKSVLAANESSLP